MCYANMVQKKGPKKQASALDTDSSLTDTHHMMTRTWMMKTHRVQKNRFLDTDSSLTDTHRMMTRTWMMKTHRCLQKGLTDEDKDNPTSPLSFDQQKTRNENIQIAHHELASAADCDLFSFGGSEDEALDDSMSLVVSDAEELLGSSHNLAPLLSKDSSTAGSGMDVELFPSSSWS
ncbi:hypothetical protein Q8A67_006317 [Cirrhinus molitorella]|uniref:Uncharacterized protein n=1 Tax=Cirrhinus molitorella TaxID=172907 RepID=A0AA88Q019_9TELE|nr:hypothetical protein Q8A67_006317 [Cirrhinus molitorella]